ncbi:hypothetical protein Tco_1185763 [Tanacetum coccineum]
MVIMRTRWNNIEGVKELKGNVRIKGEKKEALHTTLGRNQGENAVHKINFAAYSVIKCEGSGVGVDTAYPRHGYTVSSMMDTAY